MEATSQPPSLLDHLLAYLDDLADHLAILPAHFPPHAAFDRIRQRVAVRHKRPPFHPTHTSGRSTAPWDQFFDAPFEGMEGHRYQLLDAASDANENKKTMPVWDTIRDDLHLAVILGDPGYGKSWLLQHEARRAALTAASALREGARHADVRVPIYLHLGTLARELDTKEAEGDPFAALVRALHASFPAPLAPDFVAWVEHNLRAGGCLLLLDALDEVEQPFYKPLQRALPLLAMRASNHILLTSRPVGYAEPPFALRDARHDAEVELVAFDTAQVHTFIDAWFSKQTAHKLRLHAALARTSALRGLARIPLLLRFFCQLATDPTDPDAPLPVRRAEVYEQVLHHMLAGDWHGPETPSRPTSDQRTVLKLRVLREIAWHFATGPAGWHDLLPLEEVTQKLREILGRDPLLREDLGGGPYSGDLLRELSEGDGLLIKAGAPPSGAARTTIPYTFLHRTIHEYLAAGYLAERAWTGGLWLNEVRPRLWFDPNWHEVIPLLAGCLADPTPLLAALLDEPDDCFHTMLLLAARCLGDARPDIGARCLGDAQPDIAYPGVIRRIEQGLRTLLRSASVEERLDAIRALTYLGRAGVAILPTLTTTLRDTSPWVRLEAAQSLGDSGDAQAPDALLTALADTNPIVSGGTATALGESGDPRAVDVLLRALAAPDPFVRWVAARALGRGGDARAVDALLTALTAPATDPFMRGGAARGLGRVRDARAVDALLTALAAPATDPSVRPAIVRALGESGDARAIDALRAVLTAPATDPFVRQEAARGLAPSGDARAVDVLLVELAAPATDPIDRRAAARGLGLSGDARALDALLGALAAPTADAFVCEGAAAALRKFCNATKDDQIFEVYDHLMRSWQQEKHAQLARTAVYEALRSLAPRLRAIVGDEWPSWRARFMIPTRAMLPENDSINDEGQV